MRRVCFVASLVLVVACSATPPGGDDGGAGGGATGGGTETGGGAGGGGGAEVDTTPPEVLATVPSDNVTGVPNSTVLQVLFTEPMNPASVTLAVAPVLGLGAPTWNDEGNLATWTPTAVLPLSTTYVASVNGADVAGNALAAPYSFSFTTAAAPDTTAPVLESSTPVPGATGVATTTRLRLTFSEAMAATGVSVRTTPAVSQGAGTWSNGDRTVTYSTPATAWAAGVAYQVAVSGADLAGNGLADAGFGFTTSTAADITPPRIASSTPDAGATGVATGTRLAVTFTEAMATTTVSVATTPFVALGLPTWGNANRTVSFDTPIADWTASTAYAVRVTGRDLSNNALAADAGFSFTTAATRDVTPPTVLATTPFNGATAVLRTSPVRIAFSEPMALATTQAAVTFSGGLLANCAWSWTQTDTVATCTPAFGWTAGTLTVTIGIGAKDKAGNALAAPYVFSFVVQ